MGGKSNVHIRAAVFCDKKKRLLIIISTWIDSTIRLYLHVTRFCSREFIYPEFRVYSTRWTLVLV